MSIFNDVVFAPPPYKSLLNFLKCVLLLWFLSCSTLGAWHNWKDSNGIVYPNINNGARPTANLHLRNDGPQCSGRLWAASCYFANNIKGAQSLSVVNPLTFLALDGRFGSVSISNTLDCTNGRCSDRISLAIRRNAVINNLTIGGDNNGASYLKGFFLNQGTITNLSVNGNIAFYNNQHLSGTITNLHIRRWDLNINAPANEYNARTNCSANPNAHLCTTASNITLDSQSLHITLGANTDDGIYLFEKLIFGGNKTINMSHLRAGQGLRIFPRMNQTGQIVGFSVNPDITDSFGAHILSGVAVNTMNRNIFVKNLLDSVSFHHFYRTNLRQLDRSISRHTPNIPHFNNITQTKVAGAFVSKLALDSKESVSKADNNTTTKQHQAQKPSNELQELVNADMLNWQQMRVFVIPFGSLSYANSQDTKVTRYAGGLIGGLTRRIGGMGQISGYVGYEYSSSDSVLRVSKGFLNSHNALLGTSYITSFDVGKAQYILKLDARGAINVPTFNAFEGSLAYDADILTFNYGLESRVGMSLYLFEMGYISPEIGLAYDSMIVKGFEIDKNPAANEMYPRHIWHFPQALASVKYYQAWGVTMRGSLLLGVRYNILNTPSISFTNGNRGDSNVIELPSLYFNVDSSFSVAISRTQELTFAYSGIYRSGGHSHSLSLKWLAYF